MKNLEAKLLSYIESREFEKFNQLWQEEQFKFSMEDRQSLLTEIIDINYEETTDNFYEKILDLIIDEDTDLDFSIKNHAPTFLCLAIKHCSIKLFEYLLSKNADINYIGDNFHGIPENQIMAGNDESDNPRYSTCMDYIDLVYDNMLFVYNMDYDDNPDFSKLNGYNKHKDTYEGDMTIQSDHYFQILKRSKYYSNFFKITKLIGVIADNDGRQYYDLKYNRE